MKRECLQELTKTKTNEEVIMGVINVDEEVNQHVKILVIGLVFSGIGIFIFLCFLLGTYMNNLMNVSSKKTYGETGNLFNWIGLFVITLPNVVLGFVLIFSTSNSMGDINIMSQPGCTDPFTSSALNKFSYDIDTARNMIFAYTFFGIFGFVANILNIIFYKVENNNNYNQMRSD